MQSTRNASSVARLLMDGVPAELTWEKAMVPSVLESLKRLIADPNDEEGFSSALVEACIPNAVKNRPAPADP